MYVCMIITFYFYKDYRETNAPWDPGSGLPAAPRRSTTAGGASPSHATSRAARIIITIIIISSSLVFILISYDIISLCILFIRRSVIADVK